MSESFCKQAIEIHRQMRLLTRRRMAAILVAPVPDRIELAARAIAELREARLAGVKRLPVGGCGGSRCLTPFFEDVVGQLEVVQHESQRVLTSGSAA